MADKIISLIPAESGWRAIFGDEATGARSRIVAWGIVGDETQRVVGFIVDPTDSAAIVPAPDVTSPVAGSFSRYGFVGSE
jgi:hypothetical protein